MLNINPMNSYSKSNINFKSQKDYSKIYKEMEKFAVEQQEKIVIKNNNKTSASKLKNFNKSKISNAIKKGFEKVGDIAFNALDKLIDAIKKIDEIFERVAMIGGVVLLHIILPLGIVAALYYGFKKLQNSLEINVSSRDTEFKTDSLYNLYKNKAITFDKFQEELGKLNKNK